MGTYKKKSLIEARYFHTVVDDHYGYLDFYDAIQRLNYIFFVQILKIN